MSIMKTFAISILLTGAVWTNAASASPFAADDGQLRNFAACAGRLSAVMEHQWLFDGAASEKTKSQRAAVLALINAVIEPEQGRDVLHWRLMAKQAQSVLLTRATFNDDPEDAAWAAAQAGRLTQDCTGFLLG